MEIRSISLKKLIYTSTAILVIGGCTAVDKTPVFTPRTCLSEAPGNPDGIEVLSGPRTRLNLAVDMHPIYCNGQVLLKFMNEEGMQVAPGTVWFKVSVEYTGEVVSAQVVKSDIDSKEFLRKISDMIADSDFTPWQRHDEDTEFIYPMTFTRWWK